MVTFLGSLVQSCYGEGGTLQKSLACVGSTRSVWATLGLPPLTACVFPVYTAQAPVCSAGNCLRRALGCVHFPGLSLSGSGSRVLHKAADSVGPEFCAFPGPSSSGDQVLGERDRLDLSPARPSHSVFWVYNGRAFSGVPCVSLSLLGS